MVTPFAGLLYEPSVAGSMESLTAPPYDQVSPLEERRYREASPFNVVHLDLGEGRRDGDPSERHARAGRLLGEWRRRGVLASTGAAAVYPYEMRFVHDGSGRRVRGVIAAVDLEPWGGSIVPHERTLLGPVEDRLELLRSVHANLSAIYAVFDGPSEELRRLLDEATRAPAARRVADEGGTVHSLWVAPELGREVTALFAHAPLLIADGHHRYAVALAFRDEMRASHGPGPWDQVMMLIVDGAAEDPPVLPFHRIVSRPLPPPARSRRVRDLQEVLAGLRDEEPVVGMAERSSGELTHRLIELDGPPPAVRALHAQLLPEVTEDRIRYVPDAVEAEASVRDTDGHVAYFLPASTVARIRSAISAGQRLPEKSTYFWPKPRTGMIIRPHDPTGTHSATGV